MNLTELMHHVDHTLLRQDAVWHAFQALCDEAKEFHTASVCVPPSFVRRCADYLADEIPVCTVIGFPNGYSTTETKVFETKNAVENGAAEIDMVLDLGLVKARGRDGILRQITAVRNACPGQTLKVIVETCLLTREEKIALCALVRQAGADYIKTSTGFSSGGATREDVALLVQHAPAGLKVKASGGISTLEDAADFLALGADRLGTSRLVALARAAR